MYRNIAEKMNLLKLVIFLYYIFCYGASSDDHNIVNIHILLINKNKLYKERKKQTNKHIDKEKRNKEKREKTKRKQK